MAHAEAYPAGTAGAFRPGALRGTDGFFRAGQDAGGRWWLLEPGGAPFFAKAMHEFQATGVQGDGALPQDSAARLRAWA